MVLLRYDFLNKYMLQQTQYLLSLCMVKKETQVGFMGVVKDLLLNQKLLWKHKRKYPVCETPNISYFILLKVAC